MTQNKFANFEEVTVPHIKAAYNLARWLTHNDHDAQDVVQEACLRALRFFDGFRGQNDRAWFLKIVRNTCYTWLQRNRPREVTIVSEDEMDAIESDAPDPEALIIKKGSQELLQQAMEELSLEFREVIIMRELEGLSYKEIAAIADIPIGTVMSRLARARTQLQRRVSTL
jgi:RNA polymerase sigma-70 factor, ECF subfamily